MGCDDDNPYYDNDPEPATPQGVYSVTGNSSVTIYWNGVYERDIESYSVWRSTQPTTNYSRIATIAAQDNPNLDLLIYNYTDNGLTNGQTYFYAVTAIDRSNQESDLSAEEVFDTPRPEGTVRLYQFDADVSRAGFDFTTRVVVNGNATEADIWLDTAGGVFYINAGNVDTDLQDMGFTSDFNEIGYAADDGWSLLGYSELIIGHTYIIWTDLNHFAKVRVIGINPVLGFVDFQWAYQTDPGNLELSLPANLERPANKTTIKTRPVTLLGVR